MQQFQLKHSDGKVHYDYRCCAINAELQSNAAEDSSSTESGVISSAIVGYTPTGFYCGGSGQTVTTHSQIDLILVVEPRLIHRWRSRMVII